METAAALATKKEMSRVSNAASEQGLNSCEVRDWRVPLKGICFHPRTSNGHLHRAPPGPLCPYPSRGGNSLSADEHLQDQSHGMQPRESLQGLFASWVHASDHGHAHGYGYGRGGYGYGHGCGCGYDHRYGHSRYGQSDHEHDHGPKTTSWYHQARTLARCSSQPLEGYSLRPGFHEHYTRYPPVTSKGAFWPYY